MTTIYVRMADRETGAPAAAGIDLGPLVGDFSCAAGVPGGISRVRTEPHGTTLRVWAAGHGDFGPGELGAVSADAVLAAGPHSRAGYAFLATFDDGEVRHQLQTYQGFGVFVVHGFHSFSDQRQDYFSREFYVSTGLAASNRPPDPAAVAAASARVGPCDPAGLLGSWTNLNPAATGLAELRCVPRGSGLALRVRAVGGAGEWGEALSHLYTDAANPDEPPALLATYDHGFVRVHLQARINRGVLVVAEYAEFTDGSGRSNFMIRECFWR